MPDSLKQKTISGVAFSALDNVASFGITFITGVILARLLSPEDYGLLGLVGVFTGVCSCFINAGFSSALIRKKDATNDDFNTVFICNLVMSIAMYTIVFVCAPLIASYFDRPELVSIVRVSTLGMIIGALAIVQSTRLTKRIDFKTQLKISIIVNVVQGVVGITMAFAGFGVWALIWQGLTAAVTRTILLWYFNKWIPQLRFSGKSFRELFGFSSKLLLSDIINTLWGQAYGLVIAKCYSPAVLGQYSRAQGYSGILSSNVTSVVQKVTYPVLSAIQDDNTRLKSGYQRIIKVTMLPVFSCTLLLAAVSKPMIIVLIGYKWLQAACFLQIICLGSMLYPLHAINLNMLQVQGRSDLFLKLEIIKKFFSVVPILLGIWIGIYWMLAASVVNGFICYYLNAYYSGPLARYSIREQIADITPSFLTGLITALAAWMVALGYDCLTVSQSTVGYAIVLAVQLVVAAVVFYFICERLQTGEYLELKEIVQSKLIKRK